MASKLQKLGKEEVARRIKLKKKIRLKKSIKSSSIKVTFIASLLLNIYFILIPYHHTILTNILEYYSKIAPIVESLINKLPI